MSDPKPTVWPTSLMIRDTGIYDDLGGAGQRIYTTAGQGYEKRKYGLYSDYEALAAEHKDMAIVQAKAEAAHLIRIGELEAAHNILVERSVGAMAIANGDEGHEKIPRDCPMLEAVSNLQAALDCAVGLWLASPGTESEVPTELGRLLAASRDRVLAKKS
jgi:hypothetical protein